MLREAIEKVGVNWYKLTEGSEGGERWKTIEKRSASFVSLCLSDTLSLSLSLSLQFVCLFHLHKSKRRCDVTTSWPPETERHGVQQPARVLWLLNPTDREVELSRRFSNLWVLWGWGKRRDTAGTEIRLWVSFRAGRPKKDRPLRSCTRRWWSSWTPRRRPPPTPAPTG